MNDDTATTRLTLSDERGEVHREVPRAWLRDPSLILPPAEATLGQAVLALFARLEAE